MDLIAALASPLPVTVISELLGVPAADYDRLVGWSDALARGLDPGFLISAEDRERQRLARAEFGAYLSDLIAARRRSPGDDLVSALASVVDDGDVLSEEELIATCILLLVAGHETTTSLIGSAVLGLIQHPGQLARLRAEPELMAGAVEEFLRYDPPVQLTARVALTDASIGAVPVSAGSAALDARRRGQPGPRPVRRPGRARHHRGRRPTMCPSGRASTSAWARRWPGWKPRSCSACCCSGRTISAWPVSPPGRRTPSCAACAASRSPLANGELQLTRRCLGQLQSTELGLVRRP